MTCKHASIGAGSGVVVSRYSITGCAIASFPAEWLFARSRDTEAQAWPASVHPCSSSCSQIGQGDRCFGLPQAYSPGHSGSWHQSRPASSAPQNRSGQVTVARASEATGAILFVAHVETGITETRWDEMWPGLTTVKAQSLPQIGQRRLRLILVSHLPCPSPSDSDYRLQARRRYLQKMPRSYPVASKRTLPYRHAR